MPMCSGGLLLCVLPKSKTRRPGQSLNTGLGPVPSKISVSILPSCCSCMTVYALVLRIKPSSGRCLSFSVFFSLFCASPEDDLCLCVWTKKNDLSLSNNGLWFLLLLAWGWCVSCKVDHEYDRNKALNSPPAHRPPQALRPNNELLTVGFWFSKTSCVAPQTQSTTNKKKNIKRNTDVMRTHREVCGEPSIKSKVSTV